MATKAKSFLQVSCFSRVFAARLPHISSFSSFAADLPPNFAQLRSQRPGLRFSQESDPLHKLTDGQSVPYPVRNEEVASVAIVGAPNAGKSTLMNALIGARIAAVSRKVNTTRRRIVGVHTSSNKQLLFWDTPGVVERKFQSSVGPDRRELASAGWGAAVDADIAILVVDAARRSGCLAITSNLLRQLSEFRRLRALRDGLTSPPPLLLVLSKCDLVRPRSRLLDLTLSFQEQIPDFEKVVTDPVHLVSGSNGKGVSHLRDALLSKTQPAPFECDARAVTDEQDVDVLEQHIWEKLLHRVHEEVPYQCRLEIEDWRELEHAAVVSAVLRVRKARHIPIVVGPHGDVVRWIAEEASASSSIALKRKVCLRLRVAVGCNS